MIPDQTNLLTATWLLRPNGNRSGACSLFLDLCRKYVPAALPVVFGATDPPRRSFQKWGEREFEASWFSPQLETWESTFPFIYGVANVNHPSDYGRVSIKFASIAVEERADRVTLTSFFIEFADALDCFYAQVGVERRYFPPEGRGPEVSQPSIQPGWDGLPIGDLWLAYLGHEYADELAPYLDLQRTPGNRQLHEFNEAWLGDERRDDATFVGLVPDQYLRSHSSLLRRNAVISRSELRQGLGTHPADTIPQGLRH